MSCRDTFHDIVINALVKEGWVITHDPYLLKFKPRDLQMDIGAEMPIAAEKEGRKIAVEVKSFLGASGINDLENALGQYVVYRSLLRNQEPGRIPYLAMPANSYDVLLAHDLGQLILTEENVNLILYDSDLEVIKQWIERKNIAPS